MQSCTAASSWSITPSSIDSSKPNLAMDVAVSDADQRPSTGKKRIPKACSSCRHSKVRCDESRPTCGRCRTLKKSCAYIERPRTADESRIEELEEQVAMLQQQIHTQAINWNPSTIDQASSTQGRPDISSPPSVTSVTGPALSYEPSLKRKRSHVQVLKQITIHDFIAEGILTEAQAVSYFTSFFRGCDRFVPIFDPSDSFQSVRSRSSLLLNAICAVGCGITPDASVDDRFLQLRLKRWLTIVILSPQARALETVQALLVMACWLPERSLILAIATRMALELQLDDAFDHLVSLSFRSADGPEAFLLMKRARTWFGLLVLEKILQVDAGNLLGLKLKGVRRCRVLLNRPFSATLDSRLFSQVELNHLRAKINENLANNQQEILQAVQDARVDLDVWSQDWLRIMESSPLSGSELPLLVTNLMVQKHWADAMAALRAIRATGIHNIDIMSPEQKEALCMAKEALQAHLDILVARPEYIDNFRYAMDFVWAKCAFSFLLLLKFTILLPETGDHDLLQKGRTLYQRAEQYSGHGASKIYLRLLLLSIEKYSSRDQVQSAELDTFIPDEFIFEWDFPGLNLFSSPRGWDLLFDEYLLGDDLFAGIGT